MSAVRDAALAEGAADYRTEYRVWHADGQWIDVLDHALVVRDDSGRAVREVGVVADVSAAPGDAGCATPAG